MFAHFVEKKQGRKGTRHTLSFGRLLQSWSITHKKVYLAGTCGKRQPFRNPGPKLFMTVN